MPSDSHKAMGLIFSLFNVASAREVPFTMESANGRRSDVIHDSRLWYRYCKQSSRDPQLCIHVRNHVLLCHDDYLAQWKAF